MGDRLRLLGRWRVVTGVLGVFALFSGAALLTNIIAGVSLPLALGGLALLVLIGLGIVVTRTDAEANARLMRVALVGIGAGIVATVCYDIAKATLSQLDPSPYNPFEATRTFGTLLIGSAASDTAIQAAGWSFHLLNGTCFGLAYCFLFARDGRTSLRYAVLTGMGWGVFLETFQLTLYPGWLDVRFYEEFVTISALSHLVYGAILGLLCRAALRRWLREPLEPA